MVKVKGQIHEGVQFPSVEVFLVLERLSLIVRCVVMLNIDFIFANIQYIIIFQLLFANTDIDQCDTHNCEFNAFWNICVVSHCQRQI